MVNVIMYMQMVKLCFSETPLTKFFFSSTLKWKFDFSQVVPAETSLFVYALVLANENSSKFIDRLGSDAGRVGPPPAYSARRPPPAFLIFGPLLSLNYDAYIQTNRGLANWHIVCFRLLLRSWLVYCACVMSAPKKPRYEEAFVKLAEEYPSICPLRCGAHVMNLVIKNIIKSACADGLGIVEKFVSEGKVKRYVETRWNSFFDKLGEILRGPFLIAPQEKNDLEKSQKLIQPVIDVLNYSQKNDATWDVFINKYKNLMTDQTLPRVTVDSLKKYEKYLVNCITEILNAIENASEISEKTSDWLRSFSIDRLTDIETAAMMHSIDSSIDKKTSENLLKFKWIVLSKFSVSEAEVERVFARHKAVHTNMRARLQNELVEQMLFIRYNAFVCKMVATAFDDLYDDEENESFEAIEDYE